MRWLAFVLSVLKLVLSATFNTMHTGRLKASAGKLSQLVVTVWTQLQTFRF